MATVETRKQTVIEVVNGKDGKPTTKAGTPLMRLDGEVAKMMGALHGSDGKRYVMVEPRPQSVD